MPQNGYGMGVAVGDYDNDGFHDLYVTGYGGNTLYHNNGDGTFTDVTGRAGVGASGWSASAGFFDYDNDGRLDLFVTRYVDWTFETNRYCGEKKPGYRAYCHPDNYAGATNILYHNNGDGTFTDVSTKAGIADANGKGLGVAFADYDDDGFMDIYVANDSVQSFLYHNNRDGTFTEEGLRRRRGVQRGRQDLRRHGRRLRRLRQRRPARRRRHGPLERALSRCFTRTRDGSFRDATNTLRSSAALTLLFSGWSTRFFDYDNDGWKDLFVAQGHVMDTIEKTSPNLTLSAAAAAAAQRVGPILASRRRATPSTQNWAGRGAAFGDLDNDGDIDVVVSNVGAEGPRAAERRRQRATTG